MKTNLVHRDMFDQVYDERERYRKALENIAKYDTPGYSGIIQNLAAIATEALSA